MKHALISVIAIVQMLVINRCNDSIRESPEPAEKNVVVDYRQEMRKFVTDLGAYARSYNPNFLIVPQNGQELVTNTGEGDGTPQTTYLQAIDATGREDMFYGYYNKDDVRTPKEDEEYLLDLCLVCEQFDVEVLATDYCYTPSKMDDSYQLNEQYGFISFAADERNLNQIPRYPAKPYHENSDNITHISQAKNFLYLINSEHFTTKQDFISAVSSTNYDVVIMDLFHFGVAYTNAEIEQLKTKQNGGSRLVLGYLSIGEAEDYRYYWNDEWKTNKPGWLEPENPDWEGNYKVKYWYPDWQKIIFGNEESYLKQIVNAGFDGAYLDIVDGFEYFEEM
ncbi:endo alpha-1,4 polygalactosaminidase [Rapidithrix thailandica]|uniref:Endo alpha-1,4 polygalactosaminidase n=1 Tax=Rapidithrix thailandica TaxID=413964 RepID=A0AAW9SF13_9BACT